MAENTTTLSEYRQLQANRPTRTRQRKPNGLHVWMQNRLSEVIESGEEIELTGQMNYQKGLHRGTPMPASAIRSTYNRVFGDEMKAAGIVVDVISWNLDGEYLDDESEHRSFLAPQSEQ